MADTPEVLKRLEPELWADSGAEVKWLLSLTHALLESQGELLTRVTDEGHDGGCDKVLHEWHDDDCQPCTCGLLEMIARAERLQKGEV